MPKVLMGHRLRTRGLKLEAIEESSNLVGELWLMGIVA